MQCPSLALEVDVGPGRTCAENVRDATVATVLAHQIERHVLAGPFREAAAIRPLMRAVTIPWIRLRATSVRAKILLEDGSTIIAFLLFENGYLSIDSTTNATLHWSPGDTLGVDAVGDANGVGSFSGTAVAPAELEGVIPAMAMLPTISGAADFAITWNGTGVSSSTVTLEITALRGEALGFDGAIAL